MSIEGLIVGGFMLVVALWWVLSPLLEKHRAAGNEAAQQKQRERLLMVYERVLNNIRDLDEDFSTGKMPTGSYQQEREEWVQEGIHVLMALDEMTPVPTPHGGSDNLDDEIEKAIAAYRARADQT
jgi:hypothetical protein